MNLVKTIISVFSCGYCGNTKMKLTDTRCEFCGSSLDWNNATPEIVPDAVFDAKKEIGRKIDKIKPKLTKNVSEYPVIGDFMTVPSESVEFEKLEPPYSHIIEPISTKTPFN